VKKLYGVVSLLFCALASGAQDMHGHAIPSASGAAAHPGSLVAARQHRDIEPPVDLQHARGPVADPHGAATREDVRDGHDATVADAERGGVGVRHPDGLHRRRRTTAAARNRRDREHQGGAEAHRGGAVVERTTRTGSWSRTARVSRPFMRSSNSASASRPISCRGWLTVVSRMWLSAATNVLS